MGTNVIDNNVQKFIDKLGLPTLANILLKTFDECQTFYRDYYKKNANVIDDLLDYREYKLSISDMTFDKYLEMCRNLGVKVAFENTFLQPISMQEAALIEKAIFSGKVTLEHIYNSFRQNINVNVLKYVL